MMEIVLMEMDELMNVLLKMAMPALLRIQKVYEVCAQIH